MNGGYILGDLAAPAITGAGFLIPAAAGTLVLLVLLAFMRNRRVRYKK